MDAGDLAETQAELQAVKKALRDGAAYLGMKADTLQRYLLQLSEKENLLLSRQLQCTKVPSTRAFLSHLGSSGHITPAGNGLHPSFTNGAGPLQAAHIEAREPPPGPVKAFDRNNLQEVLAHMCDYEAVALESARALRALSSLAYSDAAFNVEDSRVLPQLLRILAIHESEPQVQLSAMRVLCNVAYDPDTALKRLTDPAILFAIIKAMDSNSSVKDLPVKASEAAARIVAAEVCKQGESVSDGGPVRTVQLPAQETGPLAGFFNAAGSGDTSCHRAAVQLATQLLQNEVLIASQVAESFAKAASSVPSTPDGVAVAWGWLNLAKTLSSSDADSFELPDHLIEANCIFRAAKLMELHAGDAATQLVGVEAMSSLIGNRLAGLEAFSEVRGIMRIEHAMREHGADAVLQTKCIRAMACGIQWPKDVQERAGYQYQAGVELTKVALSLHPDQIELQTAGLEALTKYLDKLRCADEIKASGGEGLVKAMMARHASVPKIQSWGRKVLDSLGGDGSWQPRAAATAS